MGSIAEDAGRSVRAHRPRPRSIVPGPRPVTAADVHRLPHGSLAALVPSATDLDLHDIRSAFALAVTSPALRQSASWQEAWNAWTRTQGHRGGAVVFTATRCRTCRGRRFDPSRPGYNFAHTGNFFVCGACHGGGRGGRTSLSALPAPTDTSVAP